MLFFREFFSYILSIVRLSLPLGILIELDELFIQKKGNSLIELL